MPSRAAKQKPSPERHCWTSSGSPFGPLTLLAGPRRLHYPGRSPRRLDQRLHDFPGPGRYPRTARRLATRLAASIGRSDQVRVVAGAIARAPIPIIIACDRVLGADGSLTCYVDGGQRKQALLDLERLGAAGLSPEPPWLFRQTTLL